MKNKNLCAKIRDVENPYEIWKAGNWEWRILKKYKTPKGEAEDPFARWFCAVKSPFTYGSWEYGDTCVRDIVSQAHRVL